MADKYADNDKYGRRFYPDCCNCSEMFLHHVWNSSKQTRDANARPGAGVVRGVRGGCSGCWKALCRMNARVSHHSITSTLERRVGLLEKSSDIISYLYLFFHLFIIYMINRKRCLKENRDCGADTDRIITCLRFFLAAR